MEAGRVESGGVSTMPIQDQLSHTIEKIYAAAGNPALWEEALVAIENFTGSTGAVLDLVPKEPTVAPRTFAGSFNRQDCADYALNHMSRCPRIAFAIKHPEIPIHYDRLTLSEAEMDRDPVYEWFGKHGLRYYIAGWVGDGRTSRAYCSLQRSRRQGHAEPEDIEQFALIQRHVAQALSLALRIGTLEQQRRFDLGLLEALPYAVFALDGGRRVLFASARAERMLALGDGLICADGRLQCRLPAQQPLLDRLIAAALSNDAKVARGGWARLHRASRRRPYLCFVSMLAGGGELIADFAPRAMVVIGDPDESVLPDEQALRQLYGLTDSEARVATALASGHSLQSAAEYLNVSHETLRSHLKHIFRKLGIGRQQDLVRALASLGMLGTVARAE